MRLSRFFVSSASAALVLVGLASALPAAAVVDTTPPVVTGLAPVTTYKNMATTFTANYSDPDTGVTSCTLYINGISQGVGIMTRTGGFTSGVASQVYTYTGSASSFTAQVSCTDMAASPNTGYSTPVTTVTVFVDNSAPAVSNVQPGTATAGVFTTITATFEESGAGINYCRISINTVEQAGNMGLSGSTASISYQFPAADTYTVGVNCYDKATNSGSASRSVAVSAAGGGADTTVPSVTGVGPSTATQNVAVTLTATATDNVAINKCFLTVDGVTSPSSMNYSGTTASQSHTFTTTGNHPISVTCSDTSNNSSTGAATVTVSAAGGGTTASLGTLTPATATAGSATNFSTTITDSSNKYDTCVLFVSSANVGSLTRSGSNITGSYTFASAGSPPAYVRCHRSSDANTPPEYIVTSTITVTVSASTPAVDTVSPSVSDVYPTSVVSGVATDYTATYADAVGVTSCTLFIDGVSVGSMNSSVGLSGTARLSYTLSSVGNHTAVVTCRDAAGNTGTSPTRTVAVVATAGSIDVTPPMVGVVSPLTATAGNSQLMYAPVSDNLGVSSCTLETRTGSGAVSSYAMNISGANATLVYAFPSSSLASTVAMRVVCRDVTGNSTAGSEVNVAVSSTGSASSSVDTDNDGLSDSLENGVYTSNAGVVDTDGDGNSDAVEVRFGYSPTTSGLLRNASGNPLPGALIKLVCPTGASVNHPCKAVYYYGQDGKRHAFPNEKVYYTWYTNFGAVQSVNQTFMNTLPLGKNVSYHPGTRLVKFQTLNTVYVVAPGRLLRGVASAAVAATIYGSDWSGKIDDINDAFYGDYLFGETITSSGAFTPSAYTGTLPGIDAHL